jgi:6-phosphogluconolactonase (cycloisomerase 2 family)
MAADKKSARLFTSGATGITVWNVGEDGALTPVAGSPFSVTTTECSGAPCALLGVAAVPIKKRLFVYAAEFDQNQLRGFEVQPDGTLVELDASPFPTGTNPDGIASVKNLLFATGEGDGTVASFVVGEDGTLAPAPGSPLALDPTPIFVFNATPDAKGKYLYVVDDGFNDEVNDDNDEPVAVYAFTVDKNTAALTPVAGSPFETGMPPNSVVGATGASSAKKLLVAVGFSEVDDDLQVFKIGKGGVLTPLGTVQDSGLNTLAHALDPKGKWFLTASDANLRVNTINGKTGAVDPVDQQPLGGADSNAIVLLKR